MMPSPHLSDFSSHGRHGIFTDFYSGQDGAVIYTETMAVIPKRVRDSVHAHLVNISSVLTLLFARGPSAIFRAVVTVVVDAVYAVILGGWLTHVLQKVLKRIPSFTHRDSPASVVMVVGYAGPITSVSDAHPCVIDLCFRDGVAVFEVLPRNKFRHTATAGLGSFTSQVFAPNLDPLSTDAKAQPMARSCSLAKHDKS